MRWTARVRRVTGSTRHTMAGTGRLADAERLSIEPEGDGPTMLLIRYAADGAFAGDTWHLTYEDALRQAKLEFDVEAADWVAEA